MHLRFLAFFIFFTQLVIAQDLTLHLSAEKEWPNSIRYPEKIIDSIEGNEVSQLVLTELYAQGYLQASIDKIFERNDTVHGQFYLGEPIRQVLLDSIPVQITENQSIGLSKKISANKPIEFVRWMNVQEQVITYYENHGRPFASSRLQPKQFLSDTIIGSWILEPNQLILFDTIEVIGQARLNPRFVAAYLEIEKGRPYEERKVQEINRRLNELPFVELERNPEINFIENEARMKFFMKPRKNSRFNFILGVLPNNDITGRLLLTGQAELELINPFGTGKEISFNWKALRAQTQELDVHFNYPYLLWTPIGIDVEFDLYKNDTTYLDVGYKTGIQYRIIGTNFVEAFVAQKTTSLLEVDTFRIKQTQQLPATLDVSTTSFGLGFNYSQLDYKFNPRKGWTTDMNVSAGRKKVKRNNSITSLVDPMGEFDFSSLYDTLSNQSVQLKFSYTMANYFPIKQRSTIKAQVAGGFISGDNLFQNELYRIGGNQLLRGFDEESILSSMHHIFTLEYRYHLSRNSYFYVFTDGAYVEHNSRNVELDDTPLGFGTGIALETKAGIFGISYALGKRKDVPIEFRNAKIHFGYLSLF